MASGIGTRSLVTKAQGATCWGLLEWQPLTLLCSLPGEVLTFTGHEEGAASKLLAPQLDHKRGRPSHEAEEKEKRRKGKIPFWRTLQSP